MCPTSDDIPILERPSFFNGQRLTAADLTEVQRFHQELRWLHNRSLHGWGIAFGYQVSGNRGDHKVQISAGYAIDCEGRDLILTKSMELAIPVVADDGYGNPVRYYLTASYASDDRLTPETQQGSCGSSGAVRRPERPLIRWQSPTENDPTSKFRQGKDVILAAIQVQNCQLAEAVSSRERRDAVPAQQPYISAGQTDPKQTTWRLYPNTTNPIGIVTTVSTTSAGFRITPRYQAHVIGERLFDGELSLGNPSTNQKRKFVVDGYAQIESTTASKFELVIFLPSGETVSDSVKSDNVTQEDINIILDAVAARLVKEQGLGPEAFNGFRTRMQKFESNRLTVKDIFTVTATGRDFPTFSFTLQPDDFSFTLTRIATRNQTTPDPLLNANGFSRETVSFQVNQVLRIPGEALVINPADIVLKESFLPVLKDKLNWFVSWMGVEG